MRFVVVVFFMEGFFVLVDVLLMLWLEVVVEVDVEGLLDMGYDKVIELRFCFWCDIGRCERGKGLEIFDSVDVGEMFRG